VKFHVKVGDVVVAHVHAENSDEAILMYLAGRERSPLHSAEEANRLNDTVKVEVVKPVVSKRRGK
jgi:hypothetical protein